MALRKFVFFNASENFSEEQAADDELSLGKVTATGVGGVAFDASNQRVANVASPTSDGDAAPKSYVDAVATGLDLKQSVRVKTVGDYSAWVGAGSGVGATLTSPDTDLANNVFDGVTVALGDRVLVDSHGGDASTPSTRNGIYVVTQLADDDTEETILTRAVDFDQDAEVTAGAFTFIAEGTLFGDTGFVLVTNDPIVVDTTALQFSQFTGVGDLVAGAGLLKTGSTVDVELDTTANAQGAGANGGNSGLEFDTSGVGGKLRAKVDAAGGIQRTAGGLALEIDDTPDTLDVDADGLKVVGLPALFKVNDVAVGANVTAPNLDTLVGGVASGADALHRHDRVDGQFVADAAIAVADPINLSAATANRVVKAQANTDALARVVAVARTAAAAAADPVQACAHGRCPGVLSGATQGTPYYLQAAGGIGTSVPGGGNRVIQVGVALNATDLWVRIVDYGKKAA
jgi:hypothetical protein